MDQTQTDLPLDIPYSDMIRWKSREKEGLKVMQIQMNDQWSGANKIAYIELVSSPNSFGIDD